MSGFGGRQKKFRMTEAHLRLARSMHVGWCHDEYGAPEIDPKRPYGNSDVERDIIRVIGLPELPPEHELSETLSAYLRALHESMKTALQVILATGEFREGDYVASDYGTDWRRA